MIYRISFTGIIAVALLVTGCTSGNFGNPLLPQDSQLLANQTIQADLEPGRYLWGYFDCVVDPSGDQPVVMVPIRASTFHANIRQYLEEYPCKSCVSTSNFVPTPTGFNLDIRIKHPFAANSGVFGFDVRGIFFFEGSQVFPLTGVTAPSSVKNEAHLGNPDGYTTLYNPVDYSGKGIYGYTRGKLIPSWMPDPDTSLGAYVAFYSTGQSEDEGGRRAFYPGSAVTRTIEFANPSGGPIRFGYAIDSSYDDPVTNPPSTPDDYPISANCVEPFRIDVEEISNTLTPENGSVVLHVTAWDHQWASDIQSCTVEAPGMIDALVIDDTPEIIEGGIAVFNIVIPNVLGSADPAGEEILLEVEHNGVDPVFGNIPGYYAIVADVAELPLNPEIISIDPDNGHSGTQVETVIRGAGFIDGAVVQIYKGLAKIDGTNTVLIDSYTIQTSFDLAGPIGAYTVYVENPDGKWAELVDAFNILP